MSEVERLMDEREAELARQLADGLHRKEQAEKRFHEAPPLVAALAPGEEPPRVLPEDILERGALEEEYESARREYQKALERLRAHRAQRGS